MLPISQLRIPPRVYIMGTGPNGLPYHNHIALSGVPVVALNAAGYVRRYPQPAYWVMRVLDYKTAAILKDRGATRIFHYPLTSVLRADYWYERGQKSAHPVDEWHVERGGTIAGDALQICALCGVEHATLCGVDMFGQEYAYGTRHSPRPKLEREWYQLKALQGIIDGLDMKVTSISKTQLEVEYED